MRNIIRMCLNSTTTCVRYAPCGSCHVSYICWDMKEEIYDMSGCENCKWDLELDHFFFSHGRRS